MGSCLSTCPKKLFMSHTLNIELAIAQLEQLREENERLKNLLRSHGIPWEVAEPSPSHPPLSTPIASSRHAAIAERITLFRSLFRGREDVYPQRWQSSASGKSGYSPVCGNEWVPGLCHKPKVKCGICTQRKLMPLTDRVVYDHLAGKQTIGIYPLLEGDRCWFVAADFDKAEWQQDARAYMQSCRELAIPAAMEISRSGNGAHVWIFFAEAVPAVEARQLGTAVISHASASTSQLSFASYDRLFPNQDRMPSGGFGNLIALPLQKHPRQQGYSVFVDEHLKAYADQWAFLAAIRRMSAHELTQAVSRICGERHPLDVAFVADDDSERRAWKLTPSAPVKITSPLPESLRLVLANHIFIAKSDLPQPLLNRLVRLASFQNPEFYKAQAMRMSVWNIPRIITCAENLSTEIALPRGCVDAVNALLEQHGIRPEWQVEQISGSRLLAKFNGKLRKDQRLAVHEMMQHEMGVLSAPTAFGKTVTAAAIIARRKRSTLIVVHRKELMQQWQQRLTTFLELTNDTIGLIGGGKKRPGGKLDIAVIQTLLNDKNLPKLLDEYGQIIIDECHHITATSFESMIKLAKAKYILGLTATPIRRDGQQPIIFMQCGPIRHVAERAENAPTELEVRAKTVATPVMVANCPIQEVFTALIQDQSRNETIAADVLGAYREGRKVLLLTERMEHLLLLEQSLGDAIEHCFVLHGRLGKKRRGAIRTALDELPADAPRIILATGRLIGEGFDHPPLDTLILAMPISWKGTLQQYAGRLHREHIDKQDVRIYDYIESDHPQLSRMWERRQRGYKAMGYRVHSER